VVGSALANPLLGSKSIAAALRSRAVEPIVLAHGTVANILKAAHLSTRADRRLAISGGAGRRSTV
jgi:hypothetical protein